MTTNNNQKVNEDPYPYRYMVMELTRDFVIAKFNDDYYLASELEKAFPFSSLDEAIKAKNAVKEKNHKFRLLQIREVYNIYDPE
jgi:hypothetical protein